MAGDLNSKTVEGLLAYCDWLTTKGYATTSQVKPWRVAVRKVFEAVEGEGWEALDLTSIDLEDYLARFQTLAGAQYKAESIATYKRRIYNAIEAHEHYLANGRPPSFRPGASRRPKAEESDGGSVVSMSSKQPKPAPMTAPSNGMTDFPYPLGDGRMVTLRLPTRLKGDDVNRICAFIRTLQDDSPERRQLPPGEEEQAA